MRGRAPFSSKKRKKEEFEEPPVIRISNVPAEYLVEQSEPTKSRLETPEKPPLKIIRAGEQTKGTTPLGSTARRPTKKQLPRVSYAQPPPQEVESQTTVKPTTAQLKDKKKLSADQASYWGRTRRETNGKDNRRTTDN